MVLDYKATPLMDYRIQQSNSIDETLFVLMTLGDDRTVKQTFAAGRCVHQR
ncbi:Guanine deaminase [compost metagenome]